jgi:hypothetical protein
MENRDPLGTCADRDFTISGTGTITVPLGDSWVPIFEAWFETLKTAAFNAHPCEEGCKALGVPECLSGCDPSMTYLRTNKGLTTCYKFYDVELPGGRHVTISVPYPCWDIVSMDYQLVYDAVWRRSCFEDPDSIAYSSSKAGCQQAPLE